MTSFQDLMAGPPPTHLPQDPAADELGARDGARPTSSAATPSRPLAWATLAELALADETVDDVTGYAYARVGYHRSLDLLRRNGWKGHGPVPWEHEPNRGFLRAPGRARQAADRIGETPEAERCTEFLRDSARRRTRPCSGLTAGARHRPHRAPTPTGPRRLEAPESSPAAIPALRSW